MNSQKVRQLKEQLFEDFTNHPMAKPGDEETKQIEALLNLYYRHISEEDLSDENPADLLGAVIAHWQLLKEWRDGESHIRVYNPNFEEHGWQSAHTIIEVVSNDMAFLVDSLSMALNRIGLTIHLTIHPVVGTKRDKQNRLEAIMESGAKDARSESLIRFQIEKQLASEALHAIEELVNDVIKAVSYANHDWLQMKETAVAIRSNNIPAKAKISSDDLQESNALIDWICNDHFTFLAYCEFDLNSNNELALNQENILGIFKDNSDAIQTIKATVPVLGERFTQFDGHLVITKCNSTSKVHRPAYMDFIGVKRYGSDGKVNGLHCILGLFTSAAYSSPPRDIPLLRKKVKEVMDGTALPYYGHSGKALQNILDTYPRDALFQTPVDELCEISMGILGLQERQRTRLFISKDAFNRFYNCLIYLPRERFNRELRIRLQKVLVETLQGTEVEFNTFFNESILARIHFIIHCPLDAKIEFDFQELEQRVVEAAMTWQDGLKSALIEQYGEATAASYFREYSQAFPGGFREDFYPRTAATDISRIENARTTGLLGLNFYRPILEQQNRVHLRLYSAGHPVPLSEAIPILENMGLSVFGERPYRIRHRSGDIWVHDFSMSYATGFEHLTDEINQLFQEAFLKTWLGETDNDGFNQLVLAGGLSWKQVVLIRAYSQYLKQIKTPYSTAYIIDSLVHNAPIACRLVGLFEQRFSPDKRRSQESFDKKLQKIEEKLESVASLDQDKILRNFVNLIQATIRTNFYQTDASGKSKSYISFKIDPSLVNEMPLPKPMFEIYVFSSRIEGVHLRGGEVARGGLRWSDRMEDFRTEVLGLMKAQMVKNTVIVPVGSKGGFIVKQMPKDNDRDVVMKEVVSCYETFLRGMLDLTDNLVAGEVAPPDRVIRHDKDDPYLVIAADKGTATFSDIANGIANEYNFWLGDAFASGGSDGYDHKKMGITARGAWESVKRNFRELGTDIQTTDFRVIGIGDMSGDVFGNGMLLSRHIKLVGAFNHLHIFLDPDPDPEASFQERERLFKLSRSTWRDYDSKLISKGGGIYSRSAKSITLSEEVKSMIGTKADRMTPTELINALLKAPVDLLWNGGIGTYIKAESETNEDVGDKANDTLRINGKELRCKVVGEGGNLGVTQLGRIEYAQRGGLIYTDAIDNSAGVVCSDHEVNIQILLGQVVSNGDMTEKQRNKLLVEMTD
ncbi:MAG: NAD-glutamate dehydrogenase, partial [Chromatiales bacterium]|nr:NAD-glutamate dehydrogenase [Chromatiales bacterium]